MLPVYEYKVLTTTTTQVPTSVTPTLPPDNTVQLTKEGLVAYADEETPEEPYLFVYTPEGTPDSFREDLAATLNPEDGVPAITITNPEPTTITQPETLTINGITYENEALEDASEIYFQTLLEWDPDSPPAALAITPAPPTDSLTLFTTSDQGYLPGDELLDPTERLIHHTALEYIEATYPEIYSKVEDPLVDIHIELDPLLDFGSFTVSLPDSSEFSELFPIEEVFLEPDEIPEEFENPYIHTYQEGTTTKDPTPQHYTPTYYDYPDEPDEPDDDLEENTEETADPDLPDPADDVDGITPESAAVTDPIPEDIPTEDEDPDNTTISDPYRDDLKPDPALIPESDLFDESEIPDLPGESIDEDPVSDWPTLTSTAYNYYPNPGTEQIIDSLTSDDISYSTFTGLTAAYITTINSTQGTHFRLEFSYDQPTTTQEFRFALIESSLSPFTEGVTYVAANLINLIRVQGTTITDQVASKSVTLPSDPGQTVSIPEDVLYSDAMDLAAHPLGVFTLPNSTKTYDLLLISSALTPDFISVQSSS